jgi:hypothetical protein
MRDAKIFSLRSIAQPPARPRLTKFIAEKSNEIRALLRTPIIDLLVIIEKSIICIFKLGIAKAAHSFTLTEISLEKLFIDHCNTAF